MAIGVNLLDNDLYSTVKLIRQMGGAVFYDRVPGSSGATPATATGTSAARVSISTSYSIPSVAAELVAFAPGLASTADAAADIKFGFADIQGNAFKRQPQQVLAPIGSVVLSVGSTRFTPQEWYNVRTPVINGDQYDYGFTSLVANAHNMKAWDDLMLSTIPSGLPTIFSQVQGTATSVTAVGATSTSSLTLTAAGELYEIATGIDTETALAAQDAIISTHVLSCPALTPIQQITYGQDAPAQVAATSGDSQLPQISRYIAFGNKFKVSNPILTYVTNVTGTITNTMKVAHMARYTSY